MEDRASGWRRRSKDPSSRIGSNLPTALTAGGTSVTYRYSAEGQRAYKKAGTTEEHYVLDGTATLASSRAGASATGT